MIQSVIITGRSAKELQVKLNAFWLSFNCHRLNNEKLEVMFATQSETSTTHPVTGDVAWNGTATIFYRGSEVIH